MSKSPLGFVIVIEQGKLERHVLLLVESLRMFAGQFRDSPIWVVQPRSGMEISSRTREALDRLGVKFTYKDLNQKLRNYPFANTPYAASFVESSIDHSVSTLVYLDSDILCCGPPSELDLNGLKKLAIRPVDRVNIGIKVGTSPSDYWKKIFSICNVDETKYWYVETVSDRQSILAYFNNGVTATNPTYHIFEKWKLNLEKVFEELDLEKLPVTDFRVHYVDQVVLAATILANFKMHEINLLDIRYNYPLTEHYYLISKNGSSPLRKSIFVHYHWMFNQAFFLRDLDINPVVKQWVLSRIPISRDLKATYLMFVTKLYGKLGIHNLHQI